MATKYATDIIGTATLTVLAITAAAFVVACGGGDDTSTGQLDGIVPATRSTAAPDERLRQVASYTPKCVTQNEHEAIVYSPKEDG